MSEKTITVCDGCGKEIESVSKCYHLVLATDRFWNGVESVHNVEKLDFCERCARQIKDTLQQIAKRLSERC